jgi:transglutaminase-like putative cysteine protease
MVGTLASWVPGLFLIALAAKFWMEPKGYRLRSIISKLFFAVVTLAAIFFSYGSVRGIEPGVSLIAALMSLKILEAHTAREFQIMVMVGWVLCLCGFFLSQDLAMAICLFVAFSLLLVALLQFHRGSAPGAFWPPLRSAGKLLAQALPLVILLFLLFPRISGFRIQSAPGGGAASGFSGQLSAGSVASIASSSKVAFRAEFPDGRIPRPSAMYWRGVVMWRGEGFEWRAPDAPAAIRRPSPSSAPGQAVRQWITIEPHGSRWMFALDWPFAPPAGSTLAPGNYLWSGGPIRKTRRYEVRSFPELRDKDLRPREQAILLEVPRWISPAVRELVQSWTAANANPRAVVDAALLFFRTQRFQYSLSPGEYKAKDLDEFLFRRRLGFCEHYAASFATLMRLAGIPARVVVGYLGGEYNEFGRFFLVRQADAHAWCEVWLPESGWIRVDPTSVVAPERLNLGSLLERDANSSAMSSNVFARSLARQPIFTKLRLAWDTLNYAWDTRVLSFDAEAQRSLISDIGISDSTPFSLIARILLIAASLLAIYAGLMRFRGRPAGDRVKALYERFCRIAARIGAQRYPWEGPSAFSDRAAQLLPNESECIRQISNAYIHLRYSAVPAPSIFNKFAREVNAFAIRHRRLRRYHRFRSRISIREKIPPMSTPV